MREIITKSITSKGCEFEVYVEGSEIIFKDHYGDTLTWDDTLLNRDIIEDMITELEDIII